MAVEKKTGRPSNQTKKTARQSQRRKKTVVPDTTEPNTPLAAKLDRTIFMAIAAAHAWNEDLTQLMNGLELLALWLPETDTLRPMVMELQKAAYRCTLGAAALQQSVKAEGFAGRKAPATAMRFGS